MSIYTSAEWDEGHIKRIDSTEVLKAAIDSGPASEKTDRGSGFVFKMKCHGVTVIHGEAS